MSVGNSEMSCYQILETSRVYSVIRHDVRLALTGFADM